MTKLVSNPQAVNALFEHHADGIGSLCYHPVTGAPLDFPPEMTSLTVSASLLNIYLYDPEIVVVWNNRFHEHHLAIWAPYISRSRYRIAVVCGAMKHVETVRQALPNTPVWLAEEKIFATKHLSVAASLKVFLYPDNDRMNEHTVHNYPRHLHVHIGHGDSDKSASSNRFGALYDHIFVADKQAINRYRQAGLEIPDHHFLPVGAPSIPGLKLHIPVSSLVRVLYAPTWEGTSPTKNFSSLADIQPRLEEYAETSSEKLKIRLHPFLGGRDIAFKSYSQAVSKWCSKTINKVEQFDESDILICDISGILSEYLFTGRPIAIPVSSQNDWLCNYLIETGLSSYVYSWNFDQISLSDFLLQIVADPKRSQRLARRDELFAGAEDFDSSLVNFEKGLDTVVLNHYWRALRSGRMMKARSPCSGDPFWLELETKIRSGALTLIP
jgi:hypothetical protein